MMVWHILKKDWTLLWPLVSGLAVLQGLLAGQARAAEVCLEHLSGRLAPPETTDAHLARQLAEGGVHGFVELFGVDLDGELDLVPLEGFDGGSHADGECSGGPPAF